MITAGEKRSSVTSEPDSLITNAAKDLLVYQSEPRALPFPPGHGSHYHEPVGPCDPDTLLAMARSQQGNPKPPPLSPHTCTQFDKYTHKQYSQMFRITTYAHVHCAPKQGHEQTLKKRCTYVNMYMQTCENVYDARTQKHTKTHTKHGPQRPECGR